MESGCSRRGGSRMWRMCAGGACTAAEVVYVYMLITDSKMESRIPNWNPEVLVMNPKFQTGILKFLSQESRILLGIPRKETRSGKLRRIMGKKLLKGDAKSEMKLNSPRHRHRHRRHHRRRRRHRLCLQVRTNPRRCLLRCYRQTYLPTHGHELLG